MTSSPPSEDILYRWALLEDGSTVHANELAHNRRKNVFLLCPACDTELVLAAGAIVRAHFRHKLRTELTCIPERALHFAGIHAAEEMFGEHLKSGQPLFIQEEVESTCFRFRTLLGKPCVNLLRRRWNVLEHTSGTTIVPTPLKWAPMLFLDQKDGSRIQVQIETGCPTGHVFDGRKITLDLRKLKLAGVQPENCRMESAMTEKGENCICSAHEYPGFALYKSGKKWAGLKTLEEWHRIHESPSTEFMVLGPKDLRHENYMRFFLAHKDVRERLPKDTRSCFECRSITPPGPDRVCKQTGELITADTAEGIAAECGLFHRPYPAR